MITNPQQPVKGRLVFQNKALRVIIRSLRAKAKTECLFKPFFLQLSFPLCASYIFPHFKNKPEYTSPFHPVSWILGIQDFKDTLGEYQAAWLRAQIPGFLMMAALVYLAEA